MKSLGDRLHLRDVRRTRGLDGELLGTPPAAPDMVLIQDLDGEWFFSDTYGDAPEGGMVIDGDGDFAIDDSLTAGLAIGVDPVDGPFVLSLVVP